MAPSCRPHSAERQLARACAVGLMTGPHAHSSGAHGKGVAGPGCLPQNQANWGGRPPHCGHVSPRHQVPPPGTLSAQRQPARACAVGLVMGPQGHTPRAHGKGVAGRGRLL